MSRKGVLGAGEERENGQSGLHPSTVRGREKLSANRTQAGGGGRLLPQIGKWGPLLWAVVRGSKQRAWVKGAQIAQIFRIRLKALRIGGLGVASSLCWLPRGW